MAIHRLIDWFTAAFFGWVRVRALSPVQGPIRMWDITVEPGHEFLVRHDRSWLRTHNCVIDDPHTEAEALSAVFNPGVYDKIFDWYTSGVRQRLQPGGAIIIVQCMTGDTLVLRPDGSEIPLRHIQIGDEVATYVAGELRKSYVTNFQSSGVDSIYQIQTQSGRIIRANERHPFLVEFNGERKWARLKDLIPGMQLVALRAVTGNHEQRNRDSALPVIKNKHISLSILQPALENVSPKDAPDLLGQKQSPDYVAHAKQTRHITNETLKPRVERSAIMVSIRVRHVLKKVVTTLPNAMGCVASIILKLIGHRAKAEQTQRRDISAELKPVMDLPPKSTKKCLKFREDVALYAESPHLNQTLERIGEESSVSTIATTQEKLGDSCATTVTWPSDTEKLQKFLSEQQHTSDFITDQIVVIVPDGEEEVFDIEVADTENFIAEGVVSHNTRWSLRDLTGQILENSQNRKGSDQWEVFEFPAILPSGNPLWPEFWSKPELEAVKAELPAGKWQAQYMQNPTSDETAIIKRDMWNVWKHDKPPKCDYTLMSFDCAFEAKQTADYSAMTLWGVWYDEEAGEDSVILLDAWRGKLEFPELKAKALELYKEHEPDSVIIEKKASGAPLIFELRRMGIPVQEFTPSRGNDKIARLNAVVDVFASGRVWAPDRRWAEDVIEEIASFPNGRHDDYTDTASQALNRIRKGGMVRTRHDEEEGERSWRYVKRAAYY